MIREFLTIAACYVLAMAAIAIVLLGVVLPAVQHVLASLAH